MVKRSQSPNFRQALSWAYRRLVLGSVLFVCVTLLVSGVAVMRENLNRNLGVVANLVGISIEPALAAGDRDAVRNQLASSTGDGLVQRFEIVNRAGATLIVWERPGSGWWNTIERGAGRLLWPSPIIRPIRQGNAIGAEIRVFGSAAGVMRFLKGSVFAALLCVGVAFVATSVLARRMWVRVIEPLRHVAEVARSVRVERAFHRRVPPPGLAEVDNLVHDFNALLVELQGWYTGIEEENQQLAWAATHDALTRLGNRLAFERQVRQHAGPDGAEFAVLYLDADRFKRINDTYGHDSGDVVLQTVARRLEQCIRQGDKAFRVGGDEFAIILAPPTSVDDVEAIIERITDGMRTAIDLPDGRAVAMSVSIGYAGFPLDATTLDDLVRLADQDMYRNKARLYEERIVHLG